MRMSILLFITNVAKNRGEAHQLRLGQQDHVLLAPPYIATADDIAMIVSRLGDAVDRVCQDVMRAVP